jgi:disulfide bond formation protein DsbB
MIAKRAPQLALLLALAAIGGAWFSELVLGYQPCMLCLWQRWPYYLGIPLLVLALALPYGRGRVALFWLLALGFIGSAVLAGYHAGAEWKFWPGPSGCGGRIETAPQSLDAFRQSLSKARVVLCDEAAMRILGLSFAGWNVLASLGIAGLLSLAAKRTYGSSSVSQ